MGATERRLFCENERKISLKWKITKVINLLIILFIVNCFKCKKAFNRKNIMRNYKQPE